MVKRMPPIPTKTEKRPKAVPRRSPSNSSVTSAPVPFCTPPMAKPEQQAATMSHAKLSWKKYGRMPPTMKMQVEMMMLVLR